MEKQNAKKSAEKQVDRLWVSTLATGFGGIAVSLLGSILSSYVLTGPQNRDVFALSHNLLYLVGALILFGIVIVGIAGWMRRSNRDVILLKQRLAQVYSAALEKSAFNPQLKSASHE
jgi:hypothetical protein